MPCQKPSKFELEVNGQRRMWIMNVRNTLYHNDTLPIIVRQMNVKATKNDPDRKDKQTESFYIALGFNKHFIKKRYSYYIVITRYF